MPTNLDVITNLTDAGRTETQGKAWFTAMRAAMVEMGDPLAKYGSVQNLSLSLSVGAGALTIAAKTRAGANASAADPITIVFRSATLDNADYNARNVTGALSTVISSGSTAGHVSAQASALYIYAIEVGTAFELAWSSKYFGSQVIVSTTAEGGAGAADSAATMYSTTARAGVVAVCLGRWKSTQTTAGTWAAVTGEKQLFPFPRKDPTTQIFTASGTYTKPWDMLNAIVTAVGGGGSGGSGPNSAAGTASSAGGGGGGGTSIKWLSAASVGPTETVTVGTGGAGATAGSAQGNAGNNSTFGSHCTGGGGGPGQAGGTHGGSGPTGQGGTAGVASGGDINLNGEQGGQGVVFSGTGGTLHTGAGGSTTHGHGGRPQNQFGGFTNGTTGIGYGSGSTGSGSSGGTVSVVSNAGQNGIVIVEEFYN